MANIVAMNGTTGQPLQPEYIPLAAPLPIPAYLVAAMRANPADDGLRLQVADFFDENGQAERAEFVRWQVSHPGRTWPYSAGADTPDFGLPAGLFQGDGYLGQCFTSEEIFNQTRNPLRLLYVRGFAKVLVCPAAWWLHAGDAIYAREPVTEVTLTDDPSRYNEAWSWDGVRHSRFAGRAWVPDKEMVEKTGTDFRAMALLRWYWPGIEFKTSKPVCAECGNFNNVTFEPDPYREEIHGDTTPVHLCAACRREHLRDT